MPKAKTWEEYKAECEVVVNEIKEVAPYGKFFCLPIQQEGSAWK